MTFAPSPRWSTAASKGRSSGRRCTPDVSRCRRRWPRWRSRTSMALDETDLEALVAQAAAILDAAARPFIEGHRADSAVQKKGNDFATEVDLGIEPRGGATRDAETRIVVPRDQFPPAHPRSPL